MISSGLTAKAATSDSPVTLIDKDLLPKKHNLSLTIVNEGSVAGYFSVDGATWCRMPAQSISTMDNVEISGNVQMKRVPGGSSLANVWAYVWEGA